MSPFFDDGRDTHVSRWSEPHPLPFAPVTLFLSCIIAVSFPAQFFLSTYEHVLVPLFFTYFLLTPAIPPAALCPLLPSQQNLWSVVITAVPTSASPILPSASTHWASSPLTARKLLPSRGSMPLASPMYSQFSSQRIQHS